MPPLGREAFAEAVHALGAADRDRFVRTLLEARGHNVEGERGRFAVTDPTGDREPTRTYLVDHPERDPILDPEDDPAVDSAGAPTVVLPDGDVPAGWTVVDAAELRRQALYAVDSGTRERLFELLGVDPVVEGEDPPTGPGTGPEAADEAPDTDGHAAVDERQPTGGTRTGSPQARGPTREGDVDERGHGLPNGERTGSVGEDPDAAANPDAGLDGTGGDTPVETAAGDGESDGPSALFERAVATSAGRGSRTEDPDREPTTLDRRGVGVALLVILAASALAVAVGTGAVLDGTGGNDGAADSADIEGGGAAVTPDDTAQNDEDRVGENVVGPRRTPARDANVSLLPPGMGNNGIESAGQLATAHHRNLPSSYRLVVTYREFHEGSVVARERQVVTVESPEVYRVDVESVGRPALAAGGTLLGDLSAYRNGLVRAERTGESTYRLLSADAEREYTATQFRDRVTRYVLWYLSVESSTIVDIVEEGGRALYWVRFEGDSWQGSVNESGSALVREDGVVRSLRRRWTDARNLERSAVVTVEYVAIGNVTVSPPEWYVEGTPVGDGTGVDDRNETKTNRTVGTAVTNGTATNGTATNETADG